MQVSSEYLHQFDILQFGTTMHEKINPSNLYEINLKDNDNGNVSQPLTTSQYMIDGHHIQPKYSTNYAELPTSHNKEPSQWLPKLDDVPLLEIENNANNDNLSELPKRENEALETRVNAYDNNDVVSEEEITEQELFNKINEIMKHEYGKSNKSHVNEPYQFLPRDYIERVRQSDEFQGYEKRAPFNHPRCRMCENVNRHRGKFSRMRYVTITDDPIRENELKPLIRNQFTTSENMQCDEQTSGHGNGVYNPTCLNGGSTIKAASLEYWGDHSIDSVEHSLTQSEWNILKSSNESVNWFQNFNQLHLLRNNTTSPNLRQRNRNVKFFI